MKIINIFVASSAELKRERMELVDLMQDMNDLEGRNIKLKPVLWEYLDSSMRIERKEDEYLEKLRECEICIVMFWNTLGEYTLEELDSAVSYLKDNLILKHIYVLFKEPAADTMSDELNFFKKDFAIRYPRISYDVFGDASSLRQKITDFLKNVFPSNIVYI